MTRQLEQQMEERTKKRHAQVVKAVEYALEGAITRSGGEYLGFAYKHRQNDALLVIKAIFPAGPMVAFCGSEDLVGCLIKAVIQGNQDKLVWRQDKYGG